MNRLGKTTHGARIGGSWRRHMNWAFPGRRSLPIRVVLAIVFFVSTALADVSVTASVSPLTGTSDDEFVFSVLVDGAQETEYPVLEGGDDFDITLIGPSSSMQIINGQVSAQVSYNYKLTPKKTGDLLAPSATVTVNGAPYSTKPFTISVKEPSAPSSFDKNEDIFFRQKLSKSEVYVGEQIVDSLQIFARIEVHELNFTEASFDGFWSGTAGDLESNVQSVDRERFRVFRQAKLLYPLRSGTLTLPSQTAQATVRERRKQKLRAPFGMDPFGNDAFFDSFFGTEPRSIKLRSDVQSVLVKELPTPPAKFPDWGLPIIVGKTDLKIAYDSAPIKFGESKTVELTLTSSGNLSPFQKLNLPPIEGIKVYEEPVQSLLRQSVDTFLTTKSVKLSLVPQYGGVVTIPSVDLGYFDPIEQRYKIAHSGEITFTVEGGPTPTPTVAPRAEAEAPIQSTQFREESTLERLVQQLSTSLILLLLTALGLIIYIFGRIRAVVAAQAPRTSIGRSIESAKSLSELSISFKEILRLRLGTECSSLSAEQLRALLRSNVKDSDLLFQCQTLIDRFEEAKYSGKSPDETVLSTMRTQVRELFGKLT